MRYVASARIWITKDREEFHASRGPKAYVGNSDQYAPHRMIEPGEVVYNQDPTIGTKAEQLRGLTLLSSSSSETWEFVSDCVVTRVSRF